MQLVDRRVHVELESAAVDVRDQVDVIRVADFHRSRIDVDRTRASDCEATIEVPRKGDRRARVDLQRVRVAAAPQVQCPIHHVNCAAVVQHGTVVNRNGPRIGGFLKQSAARVVHRQVAFDDAGTTHIERGPTLIVDLVVARDAIDDAGIRPGHGALVLEREAAIQIEIAVGADIQSHPRGNLQLARRSRSEQLAASPAGMGNSTRDGERIPTNVDGAAGKCQSGDRLIATKINRAACDDRCTACGRNTSGPVPRCTPRVVNGPRPGRCGRSPAGFERFELRLIGFFALAKSAAV